MSDQDIRVSRVLQALAKNLDSVLYDIAGKRVGFCLIVFSDEAEGQTSYVANTDREKTVAAIRDLLNRWDQGMLDIPAHEKH